MCFSNIGHPTISSPSRTFYFKNVLHCPQVFTNLHSVQKFSHDNHCYFHFDDLGFCAKDKTTDQTLYRETLKNGLYPFPLGSSSSSLGPTSFLSRHLSAVLWHQRLGHPSSTIQNATFSTCSSPIRRGKNMICSSCQLGKSCKLPFASSPSVSLSPLALVQCDVWGPAPVLSFSGFKYYVLFVDDYSWYCCLFPMKNKSNVLDIFISFAYRIENLLTSKIKVFCSNGGGEFTSHAFKYFK